MDRQTHTQTDARDQYTLRIDYDSREVLLYCLPTGAQGYTRLAQSYVAVPQVKVNLLIASPMPNQLHRRINPIGK